MNGAARCFCGCGRRAVAKHHVLYEQELRRRWREGVAERTYRAHDFMSEWRRWKDLQADPRNLVAVAKECHDAHHARTRPFRVASLPSAVFDFARELMGAGPAYEYLSRRYDGVDERLERLREEADVCL